MWKELWQEAGEIEYGFELASHYGECDGPQPTRVGCFILAVYYRIKFWFVGLYCRRYGHNLVDDGSYAGPDSGKECLACTRCGFTWEHRYY